MRVDRHGSAFVRVRVKREGTIRQRKQDAAVEPAVEVGHRLGNGHLDSDVRLTDFDQLNAQPRGVLVGSQQSCDPIAVDHVSSQAANKAREVRSR